MSQFPSSASDSIRQGETTFFSAAEAKQFGRVLDDLLKQAQARRRLKPIVYDYAAKIEQLLECYSYEQVAEALTDELGVQIKGATLKRYMNQWRSEQRSTPVDGDVPGAGLTQTSDPSASTEVEFEEGTDFEDLKNEAEDEDTASVPQPPVGQTSRAPATEIESPSPASLPRRSMTPAASSQSASPTGHLPAVRQTTQQVARRSAPASSAPIPRVEAKAVPLEQ